MRKIIAVADIAVAPAMCFMVSATTTKLAAPTTRAQATLFTQTVVTVIITVPATTPTVSRRPTVAKALKPTAMVKASVVVTSPPAGISRRTT